MNLLYIVRLIFAVLIPVSLVAIFGFGNTIFGTTGEYTGLGPALLFWFGICGAGLSISTLVRLWLVRDPARLDYVEAVLAAFVILSFIYLARRLLTESSGPPQVGGPDLLVFIFSIGVLILIIIMRHVARLLELPV